MMVAANIDSERLPLVVLEKSKNPRCFKNVKCLPTKYGADRKVWMTSDIYTEWLHKLDRKFHRC